MFTKLAARIIIDICAIKGACCFVEEFKEKSRIKKRMREKEIEEIVDRRISGERLKKSSR